MFYATTTKNCLPKKNVCVSAEENGERRTETDASGGEFPNREFPRSGIDGNSSGIPFSKMVFSGNSSEFLYREGILALQDFNLQRGIVLITGRCLLIAPPKMLFTTLAFQKPKPCSDRSLHANGVTQLLGDGRLSFWIA